MAQFASPEESLDARGCLFLIVLPATVKKDDDYKVWLHDRHFNFSEVANEADVLITNNTSSNEENVKLPQFNLYIAHKLTLKMM